MEGRWTIYKAPTSRIDGDISGPPTGRMPVVPCDDAAIERAAKALFGFLYPPDTRDQEYIDRAWANERESMKARIITNAEMVLRAAGETP